MISLFLLLFCINVLHSAADEFTTGILCYYMDDENQAWLQNTCDIVGENCISSLNCQYLGKLEMTTQNWDVIKSDDLKHWGIAGGASMRLIIFIAAHGLRPAFLKVGKGDSIGCGGKIGAVPMTKVMKKFAKLQEHRMGTFGAQTLFVANSCHGGYLRETETFQNSHFPMITVKGHASGAIINDANYNIFGSVDALLSNRVYLCAQCYAGAREPPSMVGYEDAIRNDVVPKVLAMLNPFPQKYPLGFTFDSADILDPNVNMEHTDSSHAWQLFSSDDFQFSQWNLSPEYLVLLCSISCRINQLLNKCDLSFNLHHRFHAIPHVTAREYRSEVRRSTGLFGSEQVSPDMFIDLNAVFAGYNILGEPTFLFEKSCVQSDGDLFIKLEYDISEILKFKNDHPTFSWQTNAFPECLPGCETTQIRVVICLGSDGYPTVFDELCPGPRPPDERVCPSTEECDTRTKIASRRDFLHTTNLLAYGSFLICFFCLISFICSGKEDPQDMFYRQF